MLGLERSSAPLGYDRFMELVESDFFDDMVVYRTIKGFLVQFGVAAKPEVQAKWQNSKIKDDPKLPRHKFSKGTLSFAGAGVNSRSSHLFIADEPHGRGLGNAHHERPFGQIIENADILDQFNDHPCEPAAAAAAAACRRPCHRWLSAPPAWLRGSGRGWRASVRSAASRGARWVLTRQRCLQTAT